MVFKKKPKPQPETAEPVKPQPEPAFRIPDYENPSEVEHNEIA